jgi:hypothetical protein
MTDSGIPNTLAMGSRAAGAHVKIKRSQGHSSMWLEWDQELDVRYADDSNVYVRSERAGQRVMASLTAFITDRLKLKVNDSKVPLPEPWQRKVLGFTFTSGPQPRRRIARDCDCAARHSSS